MKLKDIKKNLKSEQDANRVPDVYASAKKAPLNKLLEGETPARAFQKSLAIRLLITVLLLFAAVGICLGALWVASSDNTEMFEVRIVLVRESGNMSYLIYMKDSLDIAGVRIEMTDGEASSNAAVKPCAHISDFIQPKNDDKVSISVISADVNDAARIVNAVIRELEAAYGNLQFEVVSVNGD